MVKVRTRIHDKFSLEFKIWYEKSQANTGNSGGKQVDVAVTLPKMEQFRQECWVFVPASLDINALTYSREQFYSDITNYYRAITPVYTLQEMIAATSAYASAAHESDVAKSAKTFEPKIDPAATSPLGFLSNAVVTVVEFPSKINISEYEYQIKMFCAIFKSACRERYSQLKNNYASAQLKNNYAAAHEAVGTSLNVGPDCNVPTDEFGKDIFAVLQSYGALGNILKGKIEDKLYDYYAFGEEFMINLAQMYVHKLNGFITDSQFVNDSKSAEDSHVDCDYNAADHSQDVGDIKIADGSRMAYGAPKYIEDPEIKVILKKIILKLGSYKKERGYSVLEENRETHNANLLYRWSVLKKYVESDLFLSVDKRKSGVIAEQVYYSIAAGLSMIFATTVAFAFQQKYGNFTMPLFVALVVSYMLKDRIKELIRSAFASNRKLKYFDNKTILGVKDVIIGKSREGFDFQPQSKVPDHIMEIRNRSIIVDVENRINQESILFYRNLIELDRRRLESTSEYEIEGINKILLFNFSSFIRKMDNPQMTYPFVNSQQFNDADYVCCESISVKKIYYINFIFQFTCNGEVSHYRYRVMMNRDGILGLEELAVEEL